VAKTRGCCGDEKQHAFDRILALFGGTAVEISTKFLSRDIPVVVRHLLAVFCLCLCLEDLSPKLSPNCCTKINVMDSSSR